MECSAIVVRPMTKEDIDRVFDIECMSFITPWSYVSLKGELTNRLAYYAVVTENGYVVGYGGMWLVFEEAHITNVAIDKSYRGKTYGKKLMIFLMQEAKKRGVTKMTLEVRQNNEVAKNLYTQLGFIKCGIRKKYYEDTGENAEILWADLIKQ